MATKTTTSKAKAKDEKVIDQPITALVSPVHIPKISRNIIILEVQGTSGVPYCCHAMSQKAMLQMEAKHDGKTPTRKREPKDQWLEFMGAGYWKRNAKGEAVDLCAPSLQFQKATIDAVRHIGDKKTLTMKAVRSWFRIRSNDPAQPELIPLKAGPLDEIYFDDMDHRFLGREDAKDRSMWVNKERIEQMKKFHKKGISISRSPATVGMGTMDLRYRPKIYNWSATLEVEYFPMFISEEGIINLIELGGSLNGIGEWRPSSPQATGSWGTFSVKQS